MRILLISDHADPLAEIGSKESGGQNIYVFYLAKFLTKIGVFVDVYTRWDRSNKKEIVEHNSHLRIIRVKAGPKKYLPRDNFLGLVDEFAQNILKRIDGEKIQYDIIHTNYWFSGIIGMKLKEVLKIPMVHVYHSIGKIRFNALKKFKLQEKESVFFQKRIEWEQKIAEVSDRIITTSPVEKEVIKKIFKINEDKIELITIGIDDKIFRPIDTKKARRRLGFVENKKVILYVGRIEWRKGVGTLLFAFAEVLNKLRGNLKLYIIGGGKSEASKKLDEVERNRLDRIVEELGIRKNVVFLGPKYQKDLRRYYSAADVCVVPSYYEPFGIVPLEAMACGTPVVASTTGGLKFTVKDGITGYLATPRSYHDFGKKILMVLKSGKEKFSPFCVNRIDKFFKWEMIASQYHVFLNNLIISKQK